MSREIKVLHLETTDVCQAACPLCARETDLDFDRGGKHHLSVNQILDHIDDRGIQQLDKMFMCGNYGDPAAGQNTMEIYRYFRKINPEIVLGMNTNGGLQNSAWWQTLGELFHRQHDYVVFSIDGLEDTNHVYRRGVSWTRLMENARAYIATGANAHWDMLVYRHNEHQVDACEQLARDMGFSWFRAKVSKRGLASGLESPVTWQYPKTEKTQINCHALQEKSLYIDSQGRASPCCWLGSRQKNFISSIDQVRHTWQTNDPYATCVSACGGKNQHTAFTLQWQKNIQLT